MGQTDRDEGLMELGLGAALLGFFFALLCRTIPSLAPEMDLWWHVPTVLQFIDGKTPAASLGWLLQPAPWLFNQPVSKLFPGLVYGWFHGTYSALVWMSVAFHLLNGALVFRVGRQMGLSRRSGFFAALVYLTSFVHFHAYLWPQASQHVVALFSVLLILSLYLTTEDRIERGRPRRLLWYALTLSAAVWGSIQRSTLFVLLLIATHGWAVSRSPEERGRRLDRWMPLFLFYPVYAIFDSLAGDRVTTTVISESPWPAAVKAGLLFAAVAAILAAGRQFIRLRSAPVLLAAVLAAGWLFLFPLQDRRQLLFPYNAFAPFATVVGSWLDPLRAALQIDSAREYHVIPPQIHGLGLALSVLALALFFRRIARGARTLWILCAWYAFCVGYLFLHHHAASSFPPQVVSRYFVYFTPLAAWILCGALEAPAGARPAVRRLLGGGILAVCFVNAAAIPLAVFRGRLVNTYGIYGELRAARLIGDRLAGEGEGRESGSGAVYVSGAVPLRFTGDLARGLAVERVEFENFRMAAREEGWGLPAGRLHLNDLSPAPAGAHRFRMEGSSWVDSGGRPVDPFEQRLQEGLAETARGESAQAIRSLEEALRIRPFLLRYLLGSCPLRDARWLTGGAGLREWVEAVNRHYRMNQSVQPIKREQVAAVLRRELSDVALCQLVLSYLRHREGLEKESRDGIFLLRHLEPDPEFLVEWLSRDPRVSGEPGIREFLARLGDPLLFSDPARRGPSEDGLGSFLVRIVFQRGMGAR